VGTALLDASVDDQNCRFALLMNGGVNLRIGHQLDLNLRLLRHRHATDSKYASHGQRYHCVFHGFDPFDSGDNPRGHDLTACRKRNVPQA